MRRDIEHAEKRVPANALRQAQKDHVELQADLEARRKQLKVPEEDGKTAEQLHRQDRLAQAEASTAAWTR